MSTDLSIREKLQRFDPDTAASPSDGTARGRLLDRLITDDIDRSAPYRGTPSRKPGLKATLGLTVAVAAGTACMLLFAPTTAAPHTDLAAGPHFSLASWTKTPTPATASDADRDVCAEAPFDEPFDPANMHTYGADHRGVFTSLLMTRGGAPLLCILRSGVVVGGDHLLAAHAAATVLGADDSHATIDQLGLIMIPDPDAGGEYSGMTVAVGSAAADVSAVTLRTPDGREVDATVSEGSWTAWYPDFGVPISLESPVAISEAASLASSTSLPSVSYTTTEGTLRSVPVPEWFVLTQADTAGGYWAEPRGF